MGPVRKKAVSRPPIGSVPVKHSVSELITTLERMKKWDNILDQNIGSVPVKHSVWELITTLERKKKWDNIGAFRAHIAILDLY